MSILQKDVIDFIGTDDATGDIRLGISDHLDWSENVEEHLTYLQEKVNKYIAFIESGELNERLPQSLGKRILIEVYGKYPLNNAAEEFYKNATTTVKDAGFNLAFILKQID